MPLMMVHLGFGNQTTNNLPPPREAIHWVTIILSNAIPKLQLNMKTSNQYNEVTKRIGRQINKLIHPEVIRTMPKLCVDNKLHFAW